MSNTTTATKYRYTSTWVDNEIAESKISVSKIEEDGLKKFITKVLLENPDSEIKKMAEDYLIQCIYDATEEPENNPILQRIFAREEKQIGNLILEIGQIKAELHELKNKLGIDLDSGGIENNYQARITMLEIMTKKL